MNSMTIDTLIDSYVNHLAGVTPATLPPVRANLRRLLRCIDASEPASAFLMHIDQRIGTLSNTSPPTPKASIRAIRSHLRGAIRWGIDERLLAVPSEDDRYDGDSSSRRGDLRAACRLRIQEDRACRD